MNNYLFQGPFAEHIEKHVNLKQVLGYKYEIEIKHLQRFSTFTAEKYPNAINLTRKIVLDWCSKKVMRLRLTNVQGLQLSDN